MEKEKLKQIKLEELEKTRLAKLEKKYGNKRLKYLANECGYGFRYEAWLEAQGDEHNDFVASVVLVSIGLLMAIVALALGANTYSYYIFYILGYYFLVAMQIERQKVNSHFDAIISASRYHSLRNVVEAYKFLEEEIANEKKEANKKPMRAKCAHCHEIVEVFRLREYKTCKCGAIGLDYGDGYYSRMNGNPSDFDKKFDEENGIKRFEPLVLETPELEEHEVDTVFGAPLLPADLLIDNITGWFEEKGLHDANMQALKMFEEAGEICHQLTRGDTNSKELVDALGDTIVTIIGLCHHLNIPFGAALSLAWDEIKDRKGKVVNGSFVKEEK